MWKYLKAHKHVILSLLVLIAAQVICGYLYVSLQGKSSFPLDLAIAGVIIIVASWLLKLKRLPLCVAGAYCLGFVCGAIFETDGIDPGGGRTNNWWQIWMIVFLVCVLIGIACEVSFRVFQALANRKERSSKDGPPSA